THSGRVDDFRLVWHAPGGDQVFTGGPLPQQTHEGGSIQLRIPPATSGVGGGEAVSGVRVRPDPARSGRRLLLSLPAEAGDEARVYDVSGREVARVALVRNANGWQAEWEARDTDGHAIPSGLYLVRGRSGRAARLVVL